MATLKDLTYRKKIDAALARAKEVLEKSVRPVRLDSEAHTYDDKFEAVNGVNALSVDAMRALVEQELLGGAAEKGGILKFEASHSCTNGGEATREIKGPKVKVSEERSGVFSSSKTTTVERSTTVTEYLWTHKLSYKLSLVDQQHNVLSTLFERSCQETLKTAAKEPKPKRDAVHKPLLFDTKRLNATGIDRSKDSCKTPRRNEQVDELLKTLFDARIFARGVRNVLGSTEEDFSIFSPSAVALSTTESENEEGGAPVLSLDDRVKLIDEMKRSFEESAQTLVVDQEALLGRDEKRLGLTMHVLIALADDHRSAVTFVENMLLTQLSEAVGKELNAADFADYVAFHDRKLFKPEYRPTQFAYAVRRSPDCVPEGEVRIECDNSAVRMSSRRVASSSSPMFFGNGSSTFRFDGERYAHAFVARTFGHKRPEKLRLVARARQFSSFMIAVGTVVGVDEFKPEYAIVCKDKDEIILPLLLDPLPTPKEFADAIESLSPEQQAFCRAFRQLQLSSTLFAFLVVQLKPQVEYCLNLPPGSLTKEIALTQSLMDLFIDYQIPSSMMASEDDAPDGRSRVEAVKEYVERIEGIVQKAREKDLKRTAEEALHRKMLAESSEDDEGEEELLVCAKQAAPPVRSRRGKVEKSMLKMKAGGVPQRRLLSNVAPAASCAAQSGPTEMCSAPPPAMMADTFGGGGGGVGGGSVPVQSPPPLPPRMSSPAPGKREQQQRQDSPPPPGSRNEEGYDLTALPHKLDANFKALDTDSQLRPTTIKPELPMTKRFNRSILSEAETTTLDQEELARERARAFDLIDALTRSGGLDLKWTTLHVVVCATHSFEKSVVDTLVVDNVDPVVKAERASLIIASTLHDLPAIELIAPERLQQVRDSSPELLTEDDQEQSE